MLSPHIADRVGAELEATGVSVVQGEHFSGLSPETAGAFMAGWGALPPDPFLDAGATFRRRRFRYCHFSPETGALRPYPRMPYYQPRHVNRYVRTDERDFEPMGEEALRSPFLRALLQADFAMLPEAYRRVSEPLVVDLHQVRILACAGEDGEPTPEGLHHDGNDFTIAHLIDRENVSGGESIARPRAGGAATRCLLAEPLDSLVIWDARMLHAVTPIHTLDAERPAWRDTLLVGFTRCRRLPRPDLDAAACYRQIREGFEESISRTSAGLP
ncbi:MAG: 2OG-Fe dioxygenase family protein [Alphaproteobacteria bacterium]|nr:2OG-Fe dioxygenase family protein [Alphaproteobacteria bacterium]